MSQEVAMTESNHLEYYIKSVQQCILTTAETISKSQFKSNKFLAKGVRMSKQLLATAEEILQKSGDHQLINQVVTAGHTILCSIQLAFTAMAFLEEFTKSQKNSEHQVRTVLLEVQEKVEKLEENILTIAEAATQLSSGNDETLVSLTTAIRLMMDEIASWNFGETDEILIGKLIKKAKWSIVYSVLFFLLVLFTCPGVYFLILLNIIKQKFGEEPIWARILAVTVTLLMIAFVFAQRHRLVSRQNIIKSYQTRKQFLKKRLDILKAIAIPEHPPKYMSMTEVST